MKLETTDNSNKDNVNALYIGDNVDVLKNSIGDETVDLTVTSPPYDDLRTYKGFEWDIDGVIEQLWRVTKKGGVVVWVVGDKTHKGSETGTSFRTALKFMEYGWRLHDTMIWEKPNAMPQNHKRYEQHFEYMFIFAKGRLNKFNPIRVPTTTAGSKYDYSKRKSGSSTSGQSVARKRSEVVTTKKDKIKSNVWQYSVGRYATSSDSITFKHPAAFPEQLAEDHIKSWSNEGDTVLDPFGGSGTTAKMATLNGRNFIHIDISEEYVKEVASIRLHQHGIKHKIKED